jgi:hypothetical protein
LKVVFGQFLAIQKVHRFGDKNGLWCHPSKCKGNIANYPTSLLLGNNRNLRIPEVTMEVSLSSPLSVPA